MSWDAASSDASNSSSGFSSDNDIENGNAQELEMAMKTEQETLGTHFARGHEIWALCRELTIEKYQEIDDQMETQLQKERAIRDLFCKQMQLPLDQNDLVMSEFRAWDAYNTLDTQASGSAFEAAFKRQSKLFAPLMKKLRGFETKLSVASGTEDAAALEETWQRYLNFVKHRVAPLVARDKTDSEEGRQIVTCLYERAVSALCLSSTLWKSYLEYLEYDQSNFDKPEEVDWRKLVVARRAVRNVPFDSFAWTELLVEMERKEDKPAEKISHFVRTNLLARSCPPMDQFHLLSVLIAWCDSIRRHAATSIGGESLEDTAQQVESLIGGVFSECVQLMSKAFPDFIEGKIRLAEYQAKCYWVLMPSVEASIRAPAIAIKVSKLNELWKKTLDTPLGSQAATWIAYFKSIRRMNVYSPDIIRAMVFGEAVQRVTDVPTVLAESWLVFERENGDKKTKRAKKRKATTGAKQIKGSQMQSPAKRAKLNAYNAGGDDAISKDVGERAEKKQAYETLTNEHTLFLCNVPKDASKEDIEEIFRGSKEQVTEEQLQTSLQQVMQSAGKLVVVNRVCILKDRHGKLKNYGLVEVAEPSQVAFCLDNVAVLKAKLGDQVTLKVSRFSIAHVLEQQKQQQSKSSNGNQTPLLYTSKVEQLGKEPTERMHNRLRALLSYQFAAQQNKKAPRMEEDAGSATVTPKSNEDFRKMLFDK
ncbi:unnamed protein product [Peronospora destructor]|uniref:RRM domain-containing protein n=1 Tax=Peronospora destructor TaxID=86335 RepID=A0AAV0U6S1_9STRA|nr:unnamed protein product [Peronospora destructor]